MHYAWIIVIACLIIGVAGYGTYFCFTLFYSHLVAEFGWSRSVVSGAMSLGLVNYGLFALPMGWCADRFGPRRTVLVGGGLFGLGTALGAFITEAWQLYALYGACPWSAWVRYGHRSSAAPSMTRRCPKRLLYTWVPLYSSQQSSSRSDSSGNE